MASLDDSNNTKQHDAVDDDVDETATENAEALMKVEEAAVVGAAGSCAPSCHSDPNFAIVCAFLQKFAGKLNITYPNFAELQTMLENTDELAEDLKLLIVKLLRKTRKNVPLDKWEPAVSKFCYGYSAQDAWEIERFGYKKSSLAVKLRVLKEIMECQFERNIKFKADVNLVGADDLRSQPIGKDSVGNSYWSMTDEQLNMRIYQEHLDEDIWKMVAHDRDQLVKLIACLKGNDIQLVPSAIGVVDEDSSSNSMTTAPKVDALLNGSQQDEDEEDEKPEEVKPVDKPKLLMTINSAVKAKADENNKDLISDDDSDEEDEDDDAEGEDEDEDDGDSNESDVDESSEDSSESESSAASTTPSKITDPPKRPSLLASKPPSRKTTPKKDAPPPPTPSSLPSKTATNTQKPPPVQASRKRPQTVSSSSDDDDEEPIVMPAAKVVKISRPTLMNKLQSPKTNKYANLKQPINKAAAKKPDDNADDDDDDEEDDDDNSNDGEEETDDDEDDDDDEDEEGSNESEEESDDEVGDEIEEPVMYVKGAGSGRQNRSVPVFPAVEDECVVGEAIEEDIFMVYGEGSGAASMIGNPGDNEPTTSTTTSSTEATSNPQPKPMFFFGQPGCLKLSPIKKPSESVTKITKKFSLFDDDDFGVPSKSSEKIPQEVNAAEPNNVESNCGNNGSNPISATDAVQKNLASKIELEENISGITDNVDTLKVDSSKSSASQQVLTEGIHSNVQSYPDLSDTDIPLPEPTTSSVLSTSLLEKQKVSESLPAPEIQDFPLESISTEPEKDSTESTEEIQNADITKESVLPEPTQGILDTNECAVDIPNDYSSTERVLPEPDIATSKSAVDIPIDDFPTESSNSLEPESDIVDSTDSVMNSIIKDLPLNIILPLPDKDITESAVEVDDFQVESVLPEPERDILERTASAVYPSFDDLPLDSVLPEPDTPESTVELPIEDLPSESLLKTHNIESREDLPIAVSNNLLETNSTEATVDLPIDKLPVESVFPESDTKESATELPIFELTSENVLPEKDTTESSVDLPIDELPFESVLPEADPTVSAEDLPIDELESENVLPEKDTTESSVDLPIDELPSESVLPEADPTVSAEDLPIEELTSENVLPEKDTMESSVDLPIDELPFESVLREADPTNSTEDFPIEELPFESVLPEADPTGSAEDLPIESVLPEADHTDSAEDLIIDELPFESVLPEADPTESAEDRPIEELPLESVLPEKDTTESAADLGVPDLPLESVLLEADPTESAEDLSIDDFVLESVLPEAETTESAEDVPIDDKTLTIVLPASYKDNVDTEIVVKPEELPSSGNSHTGTTKTDILEEIEDAEIPAESQTETTEAKSHSIENTEVVLERNINYTESNSSQDKWDQSEFDEHISDSQSNEANILSSELNIDTNYSSSYNHTPLDIKENPTESKLTPTENTNTDQIDLLSEDSNENTDSHEEKNYEHIPDSAFSKESTSSNVISDSTNSKSGTTIEVVPSELQGMEDNWKSTSNKSDEYSQNLPETKIQEIEEHLESNSSETNIEDEQLPSSNQPNDIPPRIEIDNISSESVRRIERISPVKHVNTIETPTSTKSLDAVTDLYRLNTDLHTLFEESNSSTENTVQVPETIWAETNPVPLEIPIRLSLAEIKTSYERSEPEIIATESETEVHEGQSKEHVLSELKPDSPDRSECSESSYLSGTKMDSDVENESASTETEVEPVKLSLTEFEETTIKNSSSIESQSALDEVPLTIDHTASRVSEHFSTNDDEDEEDSVPSSKTNKPSSSHGDIIENPEVSLPEIVAPEKSIEDSTPNLLEDSTASSSSITETMQSESQNECPNSPQNLPIPEESNSAATSNINIIQEPESTTINTPDDTLTDDVSSQSEASSVETNVNDLTRSFGFADQQLITSVEKNEDIQVTKSAESVNKKVVAQQEIDSSQLVESQATPTLSKETPIISPDLGVATRDAVFEKLTDPIENPPQQVVAICQGSIPTEPENQQQQSNLESISKPSPATILTEIVAKAIYPQQDSDEYSEDEDNNEDNFANSVSSYSEEESQESMSALNLTKTEPVALNLIPNKAAEIGNEVKPIIVNPEISKSSPILPVVPIAHQEHTLSAPSILSHKATPIAPEQAPTVVTPPAPPKVRLTWNVLKNLAEGRPSILSQPPPIEHTTPEPVVLSTPEIQPKVFPTTSSRPAQSRTPSRSPTPADANQIESPKFSSILDPPSPTSSSNPPSLQHSDDTSDSQDSTPDKSQPIVVAAQPSIVSLSNVPPKQSVPINVPAVTNLQPTPTVGSSRKRRISVPKQRLTSESSDAGDDSTRTDQAVDDLEEEVVAQKRPKMRAKSTQQVTRKEAENKRSIKQADWSSDDEDESQRQQQPKKKPISVVPTTAAVVVEVAKVENVVQLTPAVPEERKPTGRGTRNSLRNAIASPPQQLDPKPVVAKVTPTKKSVAAEPVPPVTPESTSELIVTPPKVKPLTKKEKEKLRKETAKAKQLEKKRLAEEARQQKAAEKAKQEEEALMSKKIAEEAEAESVKIAEAASVNQAESKAASMKEVDTALLKKEETKPDPPSITADEPKTSPVKPEPRRRKKRSLMGLDIDETMLEKLKEEPPVRQSRRIAQIKIKEEAERRDIEEIVLNKLKAASDRKKSTTGTPTQSGDAGERSDPAFKPKVKSEDDSDSDGSFSTDHKRDSKKKKKKLPKGANPWQTDSEGGDASDAAAEDALYEQHYESDHKMGALKSDHEFSPESDLESDVAVPVKRARTARKDDRADVDEDEDEYACQKCEKHDHPEWILLCDTCDKGYHCSCLVPMLFLIPEGDWFCPPCQQQKLIVSLESQLLEHEEALRKRAIEEQLQAAELEKENKLKEEHKEREREEEEEFETEKFSQDTSRRRKPPRNRNRRRQRASDSEVSARSSRSSNSKSSGSSSSSGNSSDDEPIYKLRKRRPTGVSYMYNEYDHLIDKAMQKEWDAAEGITEAPPSVDQVINNPVAEPKRERLPAVAAVKKPRCGKDMDTESEVEDDEPEKEHRTGKHMPGEDSEEEVIKKKAPVERKDDDSEDSEMSEIRPKVINRGGGRKKKKTRKLNSLDIESEDDGSDDDFRTSSFSEEEDDDFSASDNDSSLDSFRNKRKRGKKETRRSARARRKRIDKDFINDTDDDDDDLPLIRTRKSKKKEDSDFSDDAGSTDEDAEELDSEDLCQSTDSNESDQPWSSSKKKKKKGGPVKKVPTKRVSESSDSSGGKKIKTSKPKVEAAAQKSTITKPKVPIARKSDRSDDEDDDAKAKSSDEDDDDDDSFSKSKKRRTRGNKLTYLLDDFESSDDGIKPGVKRPDTPPEERAAFIKRQEDIKRMLAEQNTEAARALAAPKINSIPTPEKRRLAPDSLSTIPLQIIQSAKALDVDLKRLGKDTASDIDDPDPFGDDLPDDFDPEDMDEDEITKMMEEEDFAQHQLKLAGEPIRNKKAKDADSQPGRKKDLPKDDAFMLATGSSSEAVADHQNIPIGAGPSSISPHSMPTGVRQMGPHPGHHMYGPGQQHLQQPVEPQGPRGNYLEQMRALGHGIPGPHHMQQAQRHPMGPHSVIRHPHGIPGPHGQPPSLNHPGLMPGHPGGPHIQGHPGLQSSPHRPGMPPAGSPGAQGHPMHPGYQGHPSHGPPPAGSHRSPMPQHIPHGHQGHPSHPPSHGMHPSSPIGPHNPYAPRNPHSMMFGVRPAPNQHPSNMPPGSQMPYGMRTAPNHYGPRQMMHDPRQSLMQQHQHPSGSGIPGPVDYPQDAKFPKLTKQGAEPKKRGRKSKAELQAIETNKYPVGQSPPNAHGIPSMAAMHQQPPPSMLSMTHPLHSPPPPSSASVSVPDSMIPTSVLSVQNARLLDPSELGPPGGAESAAAEAPAKKRGRRKKFTPLRDDLHKTPAGVDLSSGSGPAQHTESPDTVKPTAAAGAEPSRIVEPKSSSILSNRLLETRSTLSVASPPQLYSPSAGPQPSVITRLPRSQPGSPFASNQYPPTHLNQAPGQTNTSPIIRHPPYPGAQQHGAPPPLNPAGLPSNTGNVPPGGHFSHSPTEAVQKGLVRQTAPPHGPGMYRPHYQGPGYPRPPGPPPPMHREGVAGGEGSAPSPHGAFPPTPYGPSAYGNYYHPPPATSPAVSAPSSTPPTVQPLPQSSPNPIVQDRSRPPQTSPVINHPTHESRPVGQPLSQPTSVVVSGPAVASRSFEQFDNSTSKHNPSPLGRCSPGVYRASTITAVPLVDEDVSSGPTGNDSNSSGVDRRHPPNQLAAPKSPADAGGSSEFSGLVSYFSSQQDDLES